MNGFHKHLRTEFESQFADLAGAKQAIAFAYARHGLTSILTALGCGAGDEVVLSPLTCKVVPLALLSLNIKPIYADILPDTLNLDPQRVESLIGPATRVILFQHTYGNSAGVERVANIAEQNKIPMLEDCAQCLPFAATTRSPGSWGKAAIFSNNLGKPLPAGSGGVVTINEVDLGQKVRAIRDALSYRGTFGEIKLRLEIWIHKHVLLPPLYWLAFEVNRRIKSTYRVRPVEIEIASEIEEQAFQVSNYQMREGLRWLGKLGATIDHRRACCADYIEELRDVDGLEMPYSAQPQPLYYFPILVKNKGDLLRKARIRRIKLVPWPLRMPIYPVEKEADLSVYGYQLGSCPIAEDVALRLIGVPTDPFIDRKHRDSIITLLKEHGFDPLGMRQPNGRKQSLYCVGE